MSRQEVGKLIDHWLTDEGFRKNLRNNPEESVKKLGVKLSKEEWNAFRKIDWMLSDEDLKARINLGA